MKLSFALPSTKSQPVGAAPSLKRPAAFSSLDEEEPIDAAPTLSDDRKVAATANKQLLAHNVGSMSKAMRKRIEEEKKVDETVYEYDEVWDKMQEAKLRQKEAKEVDALKRKPKYIDGLLNSAATRKLDYLRAEEKMMHREREQEGDEFKDKEAFVTQAYKDQMAEVRRAEEEEKRREELAKKNNRGTTTGMAHFYRKLLEESQQQHEETMAITEAKRPIIGPQGPMPNLTITKPPNFTPKSDLELARLAKDQGKEVELNDDNQIVDKRELLSGGLNLSTPNTRRLGFMTSTQTAPAEPVQAHRAAGTAASRREINERRAREIQVQMEEERSRLLSEQQRADREAQDKAIARRNTEDDVQSARERYLQRKRQKLEKPEAVTADGT